MNSTTAKVQSEAIALNDTEADLELSSAGKFAIWSAFASFLFLTQIAYNIGDFPVAVDFICYALFAGYLLVSGYATLSVPILFLLASVVSMAALRIPFSESRPSWSSLLLFCAIHVPFLFRLQRQPHLEAVQDYIANAFVSLACAIAAIGVVQFILVNVTHISFFANIYFNLPEAIRGAGAYTRLREESGIVKANGFFLRESAELSLVTALGLLIEFGARRRLDRLILLAAGLAVSFSGSGLIALAAGLLLPRSLGRIPTFVAAACGLFIVLLVLYKLEIPALSPWFGRLSEFTTPNTSAYARFVAPLEIVQRSFDKGIMTTWLGNGAGSFARDVGTARLRYEVSDPDWAKVTYEYGVTGFLLILAILIARLYSSAQRVEVCNFFLFVWISTSVVLKPGYGLLIWLFTVVPSMKYRSPPAD